MYKKTEQTWRHLNVSSSKEDLDLAVTSIEAEISMLTQVLEINRIEGICPEPQTTFSPFNHVL